MIAASPSPEAVTRSFGDRLVSFRRHLEAARENLGLLDLDEAVAPLGEAAGREEFRISVLGRFKHGKSSVVNALLGEAVSPVDLLPCTSTVIELRWGETPTFTRCRGDRSIAASPEEFRESAGNAVLERGASDERWKVELPVAWLAPGLVLVDTPGSDEDPERLELANRELERADAALVLLRADQLFSLDDLELAEELHARLGCVIIVVNRIDRIPEGQRDRVIDRARELAGSFGVPADRVLPLSATGALAGDPADEAMLDQLRRTVSRVMLADVAGARLLSLLQRTRFLLDEIRPDMARTVAAAEERLHRAERLRGSRDERLRTFREMELDVRRILDRQGARAGRTARAVMVEAWPELLVELAGRRDTWESRQNPVFHPRTFATEIAEGAKKDLEELVRRTVGTRIRPVIEARMSSAQRRLHQVLAALPAAGFGALEELERDLNATVMERSFDASGDELVDGDVAGLAIAASVSTVVGYIVADLVLFYVLGVISGFLNPLLLAAAATVGAVTYLLAGRAALTSWMRSSVAEKLTEKLAGDEVATAVAQAAEAATLDQFARFADEYLRQLERIVGGAERSAGEGSELAERERRALRETVTTMQRAEGAIVAMATALEREITNLESSRAER